MNTELAPLPLEISAWRDPAVEACGYDPHSREFTALWTPLLGPAAAAMFRILSALAAANESGVVEPRGMRLDDLGASIGIGSRKGDRAIVKSVERLEYHHLVMCDLPLIRVRLSAPPLSQQQARRLPDCVSKMTAQMQMPGRGTPPSSAGPVPATPILDAPALSQQSTTHAGRRRAPERPSPRPVALPTVSAEIRRGAIALLRRGMPAESVRRALSQWGGSDLEIEAVLDWAQTQPDIAQSPDSSSRDSNQTHDAAFAHA